MKILYISYFYPPLGGPAVLRNAKIVKYLASMGAEVDVLSTRDIEYLYYDPEVLKEGGHSSITRIPSWDPMSILKKLGRMKVLDPRKVYTNTSEKLKRIIRSALPIDDKIGWLPNLLRYGFRALKKASYDYIYVSGGPFSSVVAACILASRSSVPLVVDYRDYWSLLDDYQIYLTPLHKALAGYCEKRVLAQAAHIITATEGIGLGLIQNFGLDLKAKCFTVYNGWDEADFASLPQGMDEPELMEFAYFGAMYARRSLKHFFQAIRQIRDETKLPQNLRIRLYGSFFPETYREIAESGIADIIDVMPQLSHREALVQMMKSSLLLLVINSSSPAGTLTSKVFEYIRTQKPILAMIPSQKEAASLLKACGHSYLCAMESSSSIKLCLQRYFQERATNAISEPTIPWQYERSRQIAAMYALLSKKDSE
ncbi:MAG: glycosyltransferase [Candidatus Cloacimonadaceae bacterium]|nr:glycosyltransferase [Candidatus Cloacimonadaceae bacterium]